MALGSAPAAVVRLVLSRVSWLVGIGVVIGALISLWASQFAATLLYGLEPRNPHDPHRRRARARGRRIIRRVLPAYRASRIDPAAVLRES